MVGLDNISEICKIMSPKFINDLKTGMKIATDEGWGTDKSYQEDIKKLDRIDNICKNIGQIG